MSATQIQPSVRCGSVALGRCELHEADREGAHRGEGMQGNCGRGIEQRGKIHLPDLIA
jgi:hypothetical protein